MAEKGIKERAGKENKKEEKARPEKAKEKVKPEKASKAGIWDVLIHPHFAEKSMNMVEAENKLVFMVRPGANRKQVKWAVEKGFEVEVEGVNLQITRKGVKKAYIRLKPEYSAIDLATRMGMM